MVAATHGHRSLTAARTTDVNEGSGSGLLTDKSDG
jgi:hypothetical protein